MYGIDFLMQDKLAQFTSLQEKFENGERSAYDHCNFREEILAAAPLALGQMKKWQQNMVSILFALAGPRKKPIQWTALRLLARRAV
ncbi:hypothetical protein ACT691_09035 [Vibrio metschnikovii]